MTNGYLYCFSNDSMSGILKIGMTERTPDVRLSEANSSDTWRPPTPYKIEFAKKVLNPKQKEATIHILLTQYTERINPKREFFRVSPNEVKTFFDLIDGEIWIENTKIDDIEESNYDEDTEDIDDMFDANDVIEKSVTIKNSNIKSHRDMAKCFTNGQRIRHIIDINKKWVGIYDSTKNGIMCNENFYKSLSRLAVTHYSIDKPDRISANGWRECECEVNGEWISTYNIAII